MKSKKDNFINMKKDELEKKLADFREEIRNIRFKGQGAKPKNVKAEGVLRKQIARILTVVNDSNR